MKCRECKYWRQRVSDLTTGVCHCLPGSLVKHRNDWCGEFATDEVIKPQNAPQFDAEKARELIEKLCNYALRYGERHLGIEATSPEWLEKQFTNTKRELLATLSIE